jgi:hypothetical protein
MQKTIILALLLACGTAQAAEWVLLDKTSESGGKMDVFVDVSSIRIAGPVRRVWVKLVNKPPTPFHGKSVTHSVTFDAYNCGDETRKNESLAMYFTDGNNISDSEPDQKWEPVTPDTVERTIFDFICAWKPK